MSKKNQNMIWNHNQISHFADKKMNSISQKQLQLDDPSLKDGFDKKLHGWLMVRDIANNVMPEPTTNYPMRAYAPFVKSGRLINKIDKINQGMLNQLKTNPKVDFNSQMIDTRNKKIFGASKKDYLKLKHNLLRTNGKFKHRNPTKTHLRTKSVQRKQAPARTTQTQKRSRNFSVIGR